MSTIKDSLLIQDCIKDYVRALNKKTDQDETETKQQKIRVTEVFE